MRVASTLLEELLIFRELALSVLSVGVPPPLFPPPPRAEMLVLRALRAASILDDEFDRRREDV